MAKKEEAPKAKLPAEVRVRALRDVDDWEEDEVRRLPLADAEALAKTGDFFVYREYE